jgi:hypothetical protein
MQCSYLFPGYGTDLVMHTGGSVQMSRAEGKSKNRIVNILSLPSKLKRIECIGERRNNCELFFTSVKDGRVRATKSNHAKWDSQAKSAS